MRDCQNETNYPLKRQQTSMNAYKYSQISEEGKYNFEGLSKGDILGIYLMNAYKYLQIRE